MTSPSRGHTHRPAQSTRYGETCVLDLLRPHCPGHGARTKFLGHAAEMITVTDKRIYVERRPDGDYAVRRPDSDRASAVEPTQREAIDRARELNRGVAPHVERVRNTVRGRRDHWRKP
jgi:hypothetical protein